MTTGWFSDETATFGDRLAGAREAAGLSRADLAERLGVTLAVVRAWEDDMQEPRSNRLLRLSGVLNVSIMWLLNGEGAGLDRPADEPLPVPELGDILAEIRDLRAQAARNAERLGRLEERLRVILKDDGAG